MHGTYAKNVLTSTATWKKRICLILHNANIVFLTRSTGDSVLILSLEYFG